MLRWCALIARHHPREGVIAISPFKLKAAATGAVCVVIGAAAGIVGASAAPGAKSTTTAKPAAPTLPQAKAPGPFRGRFHGRFAGPGGPGGPGGPAVHASVVELNKAGTAFITVTEDSGTVQSVSGSSLTIKEAVGKVVYRTVTLTIPSSATITRNFSNAALSTLKSGDRVRVEQSSEGTDVFAVDLSSLPRRGYPGKPGQWGPGGAGRPGVPPQPGGASAPAPPVPQTGA